MKVDAVVLAGAPNTGQLQEADAAKWEAAIPIHGKLMVNYVIEALQNSSHVARVVVVGPAEIQAELPPQATFVESGSSLQENVFWPWIIWNRRTTCSWSPRIFPWCTQKPLTTSWALCGAVRGCILPLISKEANEQMYPESRRTYFTLKGLFYRWKLDFGQP